MSAVDKTIADLLAMFAVWFIYEDAKETGYMEAGYNAWTWRTTKFPGTTPICHYCAALNGTVWKIDDPNAPRHPAHLHCRCDKEPTMI